MILVACAARILLFAQHSHETSCHSIPKVVDEWPEPRVEHSGTYGIYGTSRNLVRVLRNRHYPSWLELSSKLHVFQ